MPLEALTLLQCPLMPLEVPPGGLSCFHLSPLYKDKGACPCTCAIMKHSPHPVLAPFCVLLTLGHAHWGFSHTHSPDLDTLGVLPTPALSLTGKKPPQAPCYCQLFQKVHFDTVLTRAVVGRWPSSYSRCGLMLYQEIHVLQKGPAGPWMCSKAAPLQRLSRILPKGHAGRQELQCQGKRRTVTRIVIAAGVGGIKNPGVGIRWRGEAMTTRCWG